MRSHTFSKQLEDGCIEFKANYGFSLRVVMSRRQTTDMEDEAFGITRDLLAAVQGGYVRVGPWNGHAAFTNPVAMLLFHEDRWCLCIRGASVRDLRTATDAPLVIARSGRRDKYHEIYQAERWEVREVRERWSFQQHSVWVEADTELIVPVVENISKGLGPHPTNPFFPPPGLFMGARETGCQELGYDEQTAGGATAGWPYHRYTKGDVVENFRQCAEVEPVTDCPGKSATERLKSCAANTLEKGELCIPGASCPDQEGKDCHGEQVAEVASCRDHGCKCCSEGVGPKCELGCCPDRGRDGAAIGVFCGVLVCAIVLAGIASRK